MDWLIKKAFAHRGLHKGFDIPENSLLAFNRALEYGYGIELDIRKTKDDKVVVFHDKTLKRLVKKRRKVKSLTFEKLQHYRLYKTDERIPLLSEVLELVDGRVPLLIEIKNSENIELFGELIYEVLKDYEGEYGICSFNPEILIWFKKNHPDICRGLVYGDIKKSKIRFFRTIFFYRYLKVKPNFISIDFKLIESIITDFCTCFNVPAISWTINSKKKRDKAAVLVDNIIFEGVKV